MSLLIDLTKLLISLIFFPEILLRELLQFLRKKLNSLRDLSNSRESCKLAATVLFIPTD